MAQHKRGGRWRPRWNSELYTLYKDLNIVEDIKIRRLGWAGHIMRMEEERIPKKILNGTFYNTRTAGRPRTRWEDVVQRDAWQLLGMRRWRRRARNGDEWRHALRESRACSAIDEWMDGIYYNNTLLVCGTHNWKQMCWHELIMPTLSHMLQHVLCSKKTN